MPKQRGAHVKVTKWGGFAVAAWLLVWVGGLAYGYAAPSSWIGAIAHNSGAFLGYFAGLLVVLGAFAKLFESRGKPFFVVTHDG